MKTKHYAVSLLLLLSGCSTTLPVAVECPKFPPAPEALTRPQSTSPSLIERYENILRERDALMEKLQDSLSKALKGSPI